ncbi:hypothetical protein CRUP_035151 [Coryphaenoides rupestris]|nr:hypothetical protein CRUP_035151 [Coryphaenoides rupestris]
MPLGAASDGDRHRAGAAGRESQEAVGRQTEPGGLHPAPGPALPTDTLAHIHKLFDKSGDGRIDVRQYVIALSAVCRLSRPMDTLKLAFDMYDEGSEEVEEEEDALALEDTDVAVILEAMLGVRGQDFSELLRFVQPEPTGRITYGGLRGALEREPDLVRRCIRRSAPPLRHTSSTTTTVTSSNGQPGHKKYD